MGGNMTTTYRPTCMAWAAAVAAAVDWVVLAAVPAGAHAVLVATQPERGATVTTSVETVEPTAPQATTEQQDRVDADMR